jgi:hypothetical protein
VSLRRHTHVEWIVKYGNMGGTARPPCGAKEWRVGASVGVLVLRTWTDLALVYL